MKERTSAYITIMRQGQPIKDVKGNDVSVLITPSSKYVYKLMGDHYIQLDFVLAEATFFQIGDYIVDEVFGKFYIRTEQVATYETSNGGFKYSLRFDAWYWMWENKTLMYCITKDKVCRRSESHWFLTDTLEAQVQEVVKNLIALGYKANNPTLAQPIGSYRITAEKKGEVRNMEYKGMKIITALNKMASEWETEWWVEGTEEDFKICFGKCELGDRTLTLSMEKNIQSMSVNRNQGTYANKLHIFGSHDNLSFAYRRDLILTLTPTLNSQTLFDVDRKLKPRMFMSDAVYERTGIDYGASVYANVSDYSQEATAVANTEGAEMELVEPNEWRYVLPLNDEERPFTEGTYYLTQLLGKAEQECMSVKVRARNADCPRGATYKGKVTLRYGVVERKDEIPQGMKAEYEFSGKIDWYLATDGLSEEWLTRQITWHDLGLITERICPFTISNKYTTQRYFVIQASVELDNDWLIGYVRSANLLLRTYKITKQQQGDYYECSVDVPTKDGTTKELILAFNPQNVARGDENYFRVGFKASKGGSLINIADLGRIYKIDTSKIVINIQRANTLRVPTAMYTIDTDDPSALLRIGETRLRLPINSNKEDSRFWDEPTNPRWICINGYIQPFEDLPQEQLVEDTIAFDKIYPSGKLIVTEVRKEPKDFYQDFGDGEQDKAWKWIAYHLSLKKWGGGSFNFSTDYVDGELKIRFLTPSDVEREESTIGDGFKLCGMTFGCAFNESDTYETEEGTEVAVKQVKGGDYTIVSNTDYGTKLPNETLCPKVGDAVELIGWDVRAMQDLGLIDDAEKRLMAKGFEYAHALEEAMFTFDCSMMSDFFFDLAGEYLSLADKEGRILYDANDKRLIVRNDYDVYLIPSLGQKIKVEYDAIKGGSKTSRLIGMELKLDKPYDTPKLTIGETDAYSRLKKIEKEITKLSS